MKEKVIVKITGGVGNQLFQYSFARFLKFKLLKSTFLDLGFYDVSKNRMFELGIVDLDIEVDNSFNYYSRNLNKLVIFFLTLIQEKILGNKILVESKSDSKLLFSPKVTFFDGYWQCLKYAEYSKTFIKKVLLNLDLGPLNDYQNKIETCESVCLHVRRGDYTNEVFKERYLICNSNYFTDSEEYLIKKVKKELTIFIFSDDVEWVKENIKFSSKIVYVDNYNINSLCYIKLMTLCKHFIIPNSTFSWWGAFLTESEGYVLLPDRLEKNVYNNLIASDKWILRKT